MTLALQLFKNSIDTQEKLRLNLHSLNVSAAVLLEYGRYACFKRRATHVPNALKTIDNGMKCLAW
jgi:hypothetical protein